MKVNPDAKKKIHLKELIAAVGLLVPEILLADQSVIPHLHD